MGRCPEEGVTEGIHSAPCRQETERVVPKCVTEPFLDLRVQIVLILRERFIFVQLVDLMVQVG